MKLKMYKGHLWLMLVAVLFIIGCKKDKDEMPSNTSHFSWNINGVTGKLAEPGDLFFFERDNGSTTISGSNIQQPYNSFNLSFDAPEAAGEYSLESFNVFFNGKNYNEGSMPLKVNITKYGAVNDFLIGTFSGMVKDINDNEYNISGDFKIKRNQ